MTKARRLFFSKLCLFALLAPNCLFTSLQAAADDFNPRQVIKRSFPAIIDPETVDVAKARGEIRPAELVIGVVIEGEARAYPVNMMCQPNREIVTDTLGGKRIAVTWCHLCHNGLIFRAELDGKPITLVVSGMLWKRNLVMRDEETKSLWSHMLGRCMQGKMKGVTLETIPCEITTWENWVKRYPETSSLLLRRTMERYEKAFYKDLRRFVVIHSSLGKARAWRFSDLKQLPLVNDTFGKSSLLVIYDPESTSVRLYSRSLPEYPTLTFKQKGDDWIADEETGSVWDRHTAKAVSGPLKGKSLKPLVGVVAYDKAWHAFYPDGTTWTPIKP
jgi:hypothetical protein